MTTNTKPLASILCATYNQKEFIAQTIEGFLMQKVDFPIEIIINDDASTDGTAEIIRQYASKYPDIIKPIFQAQNLSQVYSSQFICECLQMRRQLGIHVKGYMSKELGRFQREIVEVCEFYVDENNIAGANIIYKKSLDGKFSFNNPTKFLRDYLSSQGVELKENLFVEDNKENIESL